jgi:cytochrome P450
MFDSEFIANPYRIYNHLRAAAPLLWTDKFRSGAWLVTRYAERPSIQHVVNSLLDQVLAKTEIEFMTEFANPLPVRVIAEMLGIPSADQHDFQIWSDDLANFFGNATAPVDVARRAQKRCASLLDTTARCSSPDAP